MSPQAAAQLLPDPARIFSGRPRRGDMFEHFDHTADVGIRARAENLDELFAEAARGLFSLIVDLESVRPTEEISLRVTGSNREYLLFDWLTELLYTFESTRMLLCDFDVRIDATRLEATARGEPLDEARHLLEHEVKAVTYHGLKVEQTGGGWLAEAIVDI